MDTCIRKEVRKMNDCKLHLGELVSNNVLDDISKGYEYIEKVKDVINKTPYLQDTFERITKPLEYTSECYTDFRVTKSMPKSIFADQFGYGMQKDIAKYMKDVYSGRISKNELNSYFEECCSKMRIYRTQQRQTSGQNEDDNIIIVSQMYEIFAKENMRAAREANYFSGQKINSSYGEDCRTDDWTYYNSDYYYKCDDMRSDLQQVVSSITDKWGLSSIDVQEIENNSKYTLDGGFDFNSGWNFTYRNQVGRSSMASEAMVPPKDFQFFYKESIFPNADDMDTALKGLLRISLGKNEYTQEIPFEISRTGLEGQIFNVGSLLKDHLSKTENHQEFESFLNNFSVFTRWYSWETGINNRFGDYIPL